VISIVATDEWWLVIRMWYLDVLAVGMGASIILIGRKERSRGIVLYQQVYSIVTGYKRLLKCESRYRDHK
jgi:hypothetical protein